MVSIIPALAIIVWSGVQHGDSLERSVRALNEAELEKVVQRHQTITDSTRFVLSTLAVLPVFREGSLEEQAYVLREVLWRNPGYLQFAVTDVDGMVVASARPIVNQQLVGYRHIQQALDGGGFTVAGSFSLYDDNRPAMSYGATIRDQRGTVIGALYAAYDLSQVGSTIDGSSFPENSELFVIDPSGMMLGGRAGVLQLGFRGSLVSDLEHLFAVGSDRGAFSYQNSDGVAREYIFQTIRLSPFSAPYLAIVLGVPQSAVSHLALTEILTKMGLMLLAAAFAVIVSRVLGWRLLGKQLQKIDATAVAIGHGNLSVRTQIGSYPEEVRRVAHAIDTMVETLEQRDRERDQTEGSLNQAVLERQTLLREVHHRVKNNLQLILSLLHVEADTSKDVGHLVQQLDKKILAMSSVHELMYDSQSFSAIEMSAAIHRLARLNGGSSGLISLTVDDDSCPTSLETAIPVALIANELISDSLEHGTSSSNAGIGVVRISFSRDDGEMVLSVEHTGDEVSTAVPSSNPRSESIVFLSILAAQIGGSLSTSKTNGNTAILRYPRPRDTI